MDKNALTEQRRETVIGLLKGMNIKKSADGGFDKDDVYECMQQLCDLYEKNIEELENSYESEILALKDKYQKYDDNNDLYVSLIMEAKKSSNDIINQAKSEVESILAEGKEQVARQEQELEQMRLGVDAEKQAITEELNAAREAVEAEKAAMRAELEAEKEKVGALKNKYQQQLNSMEEEFMEIKTNILRTAGRMDSLKSKFPNDEEIQWDVLEGGAAVDFPAQEIAVEETIAPQPTPVYETVDVPEVEIPAAEPVVEMPEFAEAAPIVEEPAATYEAPAAESELEFTLEDLVAETGTAAAEVPSVEAPEAEEAAVEINFDDIDVELPELGDVEAASKPEEPVEEISFEGLEDLFKEED